MVFHLFVDASSSSSSSTSFSRWERFSISVKFSTWSWLAIFAGIWIFMMVLFAYPVGCLIAAVLGCFAYFHFKPTVHARVSRLFEPTVQPFVEQDTTTFQGMLNKIPLFVKLPNFIGDEWINTLVELLWPYFAKAICKRVKDYMISEFEIDSQTVEAITLGSQSPTFQGVKVYSNNDGETTIEVLLKWAGNLNVAPAKIWFRRKLTIQIVNMQITVRPQITLKPQGPSPHNLLRAYVTLVGKPRVAIDEIKVLKADPLYFSLQFQGKRRIGIPID